MPTVTNLGPCGCCDPCQCSDPTRLVCDGGTSYTEPPPCRIAVTIRSYTDISFTVRSYTHDYDFEVCYRNPPERWEYTATNAGTGCSATVRINPFLITPPPELSLELADFTCGGSSYTLTLLSSTPRIRRCRIPGTTSILQAPYQAVNGPTTLYLYVIASW